MTTLAPGWRLRIEHTTTFHYQAPARASYNEVRQIPITTARQTALEARILTTPTAPQYSYQDYWGTQVVAFNIDGPHRELRVVGISTVETQQPQDVPEANWSEVAEASGRFAEYVSPSRYTVADAELASMARALRGSGPQESVQSVVAWVAGSLEYVKGVTHVHTAAAQAFQAGRGVCQDFAHLALAVLRAGGIPARYVSGYLHPDDEAAIGTETVGESHAWIEAWVGDWWALDPTNGTDVGCRHVVVARGRDYGDVPPVRGIYAGEAEHEATVSVRVSRTR